MHSETMVERTCFVHCNSLNNIDELLRFCECWPSTIKMYYIMFFTWRHNILDLKSINTSKYENIWKSTLKTFYTILFLVLRHNIPSIISFMCNVMMKVHAMAAETINLINYTLLHWDAIWCPTSCSIREFHIEY